MEKIEHIVLSGGGIGGIVEYGAIKYLIKQNIISMSNIKSFYGTSIGSVMAILFSIGLPFSDVDDYLIKRPWNKLFSISPDVVLNVFSKKGMFNTDIFYEMFSPLFNAADIPLDITMKQFYERFNISLNLYTVDINTFQIVKLAKNTFPDLPVITAAAMSSSVPIVFEPVSYENKLYLDGGFLSNYPLKEAIDDLQEIARQNDAINSFTTNNILGIRFSEDFLGDLKYNTGGVNKDTSFMTYLLVLIKNIHLRTSTNTNNIPVIKNQILLPVKVEKLNLMEFKNITESQKRIKELIENGKEFCKLFIDYQNSAKMIAS